MYAYVTIVAPRCFRCTCRLINHVAAPSVRGHAQIDRGTKGDSLAILTRQKLYDFIATRTPNRHRRLVITSRTILGNTAGSILSSDRCIATDFLRILRGRDRKRSNVSDGTLGESRRDDVGGNGFYTGSFVLSIVHLTNQLHNTTATGQSVAVFLFDKDYVFCLREVSVRVHYRRNQQQAR